MSDVTLDAHVGEALSAIDNEDDERLYAALRGMAETTPRTEPDQVRAALGRLVPALERIPFGIGADLVQLTGAMAGYASDPAVVVPVLVRRATEALEQAARFEGLHRAAFGDVPDAEDTEQIVPTLERFVGSAVERGVSQPEAVMLVQAWFCAEQWVQPVLYLCQGQQVRATLPDRARLTAAVEAAREWIGTAEWLYGLLTVLDDEPLIVLHRESGRGFRVTVSGVGDNFQLHTLLAAALVGEGSAGGLPGRRPTAEEIAAASDGEELEVPGGIKGCFNLVDGYGEWIWNEGRPADIPPLEGTRVVVLDPAPYERVWNAGRAYPMMRPTVRVDGPLPDDEAARWLSLVKPSQR